MVTVNAKPKPRAFFLPILSAVGPANKLAMINAIEAELRIITMSEDVAPMGESSLT